LRAESALAERKYEDEQRRKRLEQEYRNKLEAEFIKELEAESKKMKKELRETVLNAQATYRKQLEEEYEDQLQDEKAKLDKLYSSKQATLERLVLQRLQTADTVSDFRLSVS
jgi:predicted outer membrane protein